MKHYFQIALLGAFYTLQIFAQPIPEFENINDLSADKVWEIYVENVEHPKVKAKILSLMFENERIDIAKPFFKEPYTRSGFFRAISELADSAYKNKIVLSMLREDSVFWPDEGPVYDGSRGASAVNAVEPFVGVIRQYLPDTTIDEKLFSTKAGRLKLAVDLEAAMAKSEPDVMEEAPPTEKNSELSPPAGVLPKPDPVSAPTGSDSKLFPNVTPSRMPQIVVVGALLAVVLIWLLFKYRQADSKRS
ncbi:MAG: hypothetical protein ACRCXD_15780 [Luteolibacter sp.]